jgi:hypothetical protein
MTTSYNRDIATSDTAAELTDGYHLVVEALKLNDIRTIYGVVGIPITDVARIAQASGMRYIGFRHESDAGHARRGGRVHDEEAGHLSDGVGAGIPPRPRCSGECHHELFSDGADFGI